MNPEITIGADPELFLVNKTDQAVSAHGHIPGTKERPHKVPNGAVQVDGMATEFNIDPAHDEEEFISNVDSVLGSLRSMIPTNTRLGFGMASVMFSDHIMKSQPMAALELGCEPDFNVYTMQENPRPDAATNLRTAAGHIHIGSPLFQSETECGIDLDYARDNLIRGMDMWVGVWSLLHDTDTRRRQLYGKAGAYRPKPYGVEYRVVSNFWLSTEALARETYRRTLQVAQTVFNQNDDIDWFEQSEQAAQLINTGDTSAASTYLENVASIFQ